MIKLAPTILKLEQTSKMGRDLFFLVSTNRENEMRALQKEQTSKIQEITEKEKDSGFWHSLKTIASVFLSAITAVFGFLIIGAAPIAGAALITSGIVTVANTTFESAGGWKWVAKKVAPDIEAEKRLEWMLPSAIAVLAGLSSVSGTIAATLATSSSWITTITSTLTGMALIGEGVTGIAEGVRKAESLWAKADLAHIDHKLEFNRSLSTDVAKLTTTISSNLSTMQTTCAKILIDWAQVIRRINSLND